MVETRSQAVVLLLACFVLAAPVLQGCGPEPAPGPVPSPVTTTTTTTTPGERSVVQLLWIYGRASTFCSAQSTDHACYAGASTFAITNLGFTTVTQPSTREQIFIVKDHWAPELEPEEERIANLSVSVQGTDSANKSIQQGPVNHYSKTYISEITCNLVPIQVASFDDSKRVVGVLNATVSQACRFRLENHGNPWEASYWWYPGVNQSTSDMTHNRTFKAADGYQLVGLQMEIGNLTQIPSGAWQVPVPAGRRLQTGSSKVFLRR